MDAYPAATRHLVLRLLNAGYSRLEVARKLRIGVATVTRINRGQVRPRYVAPPEDPPPGYDPNQLGRCPGCGGKVYLWPCLKCQCAGRMEFPAKREPTPQKE